MFGDKNAAVYFDQVYAERLFENSLELAYFMKQFSRKLIQIPGVMHLRYAQVHVK